MALQIHPISGKFEGGESMIILTGNSVSKVFYKTSSFYVDFCQLEDFNNTESPVEWKRRVEILTDQLHTVGEGLGEHEVNGHFCEAQARVRQGSARDGSQGLKA